MSTHGNAYLGSFDGLLADQIMEEEKDFKNTTGINKEEIEFIDSKM